MASGKSGGSSARPYTQRMRDEKRCTRCGKQDENTLAGRYRCRECTVKARQYEHRTDAQKQAQNANTRAWRGDLKRHHLCVWCKQEDAYTMTGRALCAECAQKQAARLRKWRADNIETAHKQDAEKRAVRVEEGYCIKCGKRKAAPGHKQCKACTAKAIARERNRRIENGVNYPRGGNGFCFLCNKVPAIEGKHLCKDCYDRAIDRASKAREAAQAKKAAHVWNRMKCRVRA